MLTANKVTFRQASNHCKSSVEDVKLAYANKTEEAITFQKLCSQGFWQIANSVHNKGKSTIPPRFKSPEVLSSAHDKPKLFAKNVTRTLILMTLVSLYQLRHLKLV